MNDTPTVRTPETQPDPPSPLRLLPWTDANGQPAYLSSEGGFLSAYADEFEELQLDAAQHLVGLVDDILANPHASHAELRFTGQQLRASLVDTLRVALSLRLRRLPSDLALGQPGRTDASMLARLSECLCTTPVVVQRWTHSALCVGQARSELRRTLEAWHLTELSERAELVLSELLTNAVRHANVPHGREIETQFARTDAGLRIEVHDANETWPVVKEPTDEAESGRGLALIAALTGDRWGVIDRAGVGKRVWAVVVEEDAGVNLGGVG